MGSKADHFKEHLEIQAGKTWASAVENLDKGFQRFLRLGCLRPVANDHRESLACGDGVELLMELLALVGKDCCVGFHNDGAVKSLLEGDVLRAFGELAGKALLFWSPP